jgi:Zn-dependent protease
MNPFKHIDLVGLSVLLITRTVGWAKPVPVNPYMLRNKRRDTIIVAAAGITANIILAIVFSMLYNVIVNADLKYDPYFFAFEPMLKVAVALNINLVFFNLLPIAPLDGAHIIREMLPDEFRPYWVKAEPYMMWALVIMILTGITGKMLTEPTSWVIQALL